MTLADIIAKTERGEYHDRQDGPPRYSQMLDDFRAAKVNASAFALANAAYKGKAAAATFLRNMEANRRALRGALSNFDAADLPEALATALVQRFGRNRAEMILARAMEKME